MKTFAIIMSATAFFICLAASTFFAVTKNKSAAITNGLLAVLIAAFFFHSIYS